MSQQQRPLVSVCIPSYNYEKYIGEAIDSVLRQTYPNWEIIVVDDASSDNSPALLEAYQRQYPDRFRFVASEVNRGIGNTLNHCISLAKGDYIAYLGADDRMLAERLQVQVDFLEQHQTVGAVCSDVHAIDKDGQRVPVSLPFSTPVFDIRLQLLQGNFLNAPSALVRKQVFDDIGLISPVLQYVQDFDHWLRLLERYELVRLDDKLTEYRVHGGNLSIQNPGEHAYAGSYETVISVLRAVNLRNQALNENQQLSVKDRVAAKLRLAQSAIDIEKKYLQQFHFAAVLVYLILLEVLELDADNQRAHELLRQVYEVLGDNARAVGRKPITITEYARNKASADNQIADTPMALAKRFAELSSQSLPEVIRTLMASGQLGQLGRSERELFLLEASEHLIKRALDKINKGAAIGGEKRRRELYSLYTLINEQFDADQQSPLMRECKTQIRQLIEQDEYLNWIHKHELREVDAEVLAERMILHWHQQPVLHCFMFVLPGEEALLADTIDSLAAQLLKSWQLTVIAGSPAPDPVFEQADFLHWRTLRSGDDPYQALNEEISREPLHWISFIEPGMQFSAHSLAKIADAINLHPARTFFYTDDDRIDETGMRSYPRFKPDFNLDLLRASPYIGNSWVPAGQVAQLGGVQALPGAENYDLALRWFDSFGDTAFHHIADVLTHKSSQVDRPFDSKAGEQALKQHFKRQEIAVEIEPGYVDNSYRVRYQHQDKPKVSIIIPTRDKLEYLQPCVESLLDKTSYDNYEVLVVDNQSRDPDTLDYYEQLGGRYPDRVRVLFFDKPFNFSEMNNWAAEQASGDYLLLLNNDTEVIQPDWLERMLTHGQREDVGVVGARLLYPGSGRVQHVGVILGMASIADHPYANMLCMHDSSHMERARLDQNFSAVTAAVMLVRKSVYQAAKGMDAENLAVLFNDVDFCLRVGELGYRIVYTPFAMVVHHGSTSVAEKSEIKFYYDWQGEADKVIRTRKEQRYMLNRWLQKLAFDPAYNPNLSLRFRHCAIDIDAPLNWDVETHLRLRVYGVPIRGGSGEYRMRQPFAALSQTGMAMCEVGERHLNIPEMVRLKPDTVVFQNGISDTDIETIRLYREFLPETQIIFLLDDLLHDLPEKSSQYKKMKAAFRDARSRLRKVLSYCDRLIVSTEPLAEMCRGMIEHIDTIPNRLRKAPWNELQSLRQQSAKPRVGWAGAQQHQGDLEIIIDVVKETAEEVDWVFFGMCPEEIKPYIKEEHAFVDIEAYPEKLASLNLDLAVAPLEEHDFNIAKSNLRLLEYGILGWPVVCSDIFPYQTNEAPVIRVANNKSAWLSAVRQILADPSALQQAGDDLKAWVKQHYLLEDHLDEWFSSLATTEFRADKSKAEKTLKQSFRS
ncbi:glycosyltransferase [Methylophaga sp.]|jgi:glycosyltransferase involved in cell wall biosynthesis|uniref:glycosyltransferase n=1 Tax=Methylophaga sp. TaxID=2024840 RepID=UPI0013FFC4C1|nr:glycosyltransferase [Methylophaga sp.]MTI63759.1 glycosyltransferase [Methylophaga sp.]